jgi:anti-sigma regulatory factor (Ser/Thr protein kinase)
VLDLRVRSTIDGLYLIRDAVRTWLEGVPVDRSQSESLVLAVWEAAANAIEHALDAEGQAVVVRARIEGAMVHLVVEDNGRWSPPMERAGRGFGLELMRAMTSSLEIVPGSDGRGTRVAIEYDTAESEGSLTTAR